MNEGSETMKRQKTRILLVEDSSTDARLVQYLLMGSSFHSCELKIANRVAQAREIVETESFDAALLDLTLPDSMGLASFTAIHSAARQMPIIVLTGLDDRRLALEALKSGAQDYLVKGNVSSEMLDRSIHYAIERKKLELERERLVTELQNALSEVKKLSGLLPICSQCKKIRDDQGYWGELEGYIQGHSEAQFTHGVCPDCYEKLYGDILKELKEKGGSSK